MTRCFRGFAGLPFLAAALLAGGCATFWEEPGRAAQRAREDELLAEERHRQIQGRIEAIEIESAAIRRDIDQARRQEDTAAAARFRAIEERTAALERRLQESEAARENDRREIIDTLSRRMAELLQAGGAAGRSSTAARRGERSGWEHEVKVGESLSAIAVAYGVRVADIVEANRLPDAHRIRVGQKLFIPEP